MKQIEPASWEKVILDFFRHRMSLWFWLTVGLVVAIWHFAGHMLSVLLWKGTLLSLAAYLGYFVSRSLEASGKRPHELRREAENEATKDPERAWQLEQLIAAAYMRRTWVVAAAMIAAAIGT